MSGFDSQVAYMLETTIGTYAAPTRAIEHVRSTLALKRDDIISKGIKAGRRRTSRTTPGLQRVEGTVEHELSGAFTGFLLQLLFGDVTTTSLGGGVYEHEFIDGTDVETKAATIQIGKPIDDGTVVPHSYLGCQLVGAKIAVKAANEHVMLTTDWYGQHMTKAETLVTPTYSSYWDPFSYLSAVLLIDGAEYEFEGLTLDFKTGLRTGRHAARSTNPERPRPGKESGLREASGTISSEHYDNVLLDAAIAGDELPFSLTFTNSVSDVLALAGTIYAEIPDPEVPGAEVLKDTIAFRFQSATSDAAALTATLTNHDATP